MLPVPRVTRLGRWNPRPAASIALFVLSTGLMAYLRLHVYPDRFIALTYALPLLVCLWYPSPRLFCTLVGSRFWLELKRAP